MGVTGPILHENSFRLLGSIMNVVFLDQDTRNLVRQCFTNYGRKFWCSPVSTRDITLLSESSRDTAANPSCKNPASKTADKILMIHLNLEEP